MDIVMAASPQKKRSLAAILVFMNLLNIENLAET